MFKRLVAATDAFLDFKNTRESTWGTLIRVNGQLALALTPCEVDDKMRVAFFNGSWYKAHQA